MCKIGIILRSWGKADWLTQVLVIHMKESYLNYHYENLHSESEWLIVTQSAESTRLRTSVQEVGEFFFDGRHHTHRGALKSFHIVLSYRNTAGTVAYRGQLFDFPGEGEMLFLDCTNGYKIETNGESHLVFIHFWGEEMKYYHDLFYELNNGSPVVKKYSECVHENLHRLISLYKKPNDLFVDIHAEALIMEMLAALIRLVTPSTIECYSPYVQSMLDIICTDYAGPLTLERMAEEIHVSKYHLHRVFKKETGLTPNVYLQLYRIKKAKELLQNTDLPQDAICDATGLYDSSYMNKLFRLYEQQTPAEYRRKWR